MSETIDNVEIVAKPKRGYRSKFFYMTEDEIKEHKARLKKENNIKYKEKHYDKIKECQKRYFDSEKGRNYQRDYKRKEALLKKEQKDVIAN